MDPPRTPPHGAVSGSAMDVEETPPPIPRPEARAFDTAYSERKPPRARPPFRIPQTPNPKLHTVEAANQLADLRKQITRDYQVVSLLGSTRTSSVEKVKYLKKGPRNGMLFALKEIKARLLLTDVDRASVNREFLLGQRLDHRHLVRYYQRWDIKTASFFLIEFCELGSLQSYLTNHPLYSTEAANRRHSRSTRRNHERPLVWHIMFDVLEALLYMNSLSYAHLDIKSGNIFLKVGPGGSRSVIAKVGDFGNAYHLGSGDLCQEGDGVYIAPELVSGFLVQVEPSAKADIFSVGMVVLEMATPFAINVEVWNKVRHGDIRGLEFMSPDLVDLVKAMLLADPKDRPDADAIFRHPTIRKRVSAMGRTHPSDYIETDVQLHLNEMTLSTSSPPKSPSIERSSKKPRLSYPVKKDLFGLFTDVS